MDQPKQRCKHKKESPQALLACLRACVTTAWLPAEEGKHIGRWAGDCENATSSSVRLGASRKEGLQFYCACASSACRRKDGAQHREKMSRSGHLMLYFIQHQPSVLVSVASQCALRDCSPSLDSAFKSIYIHD